MKRRKWLYITGSLLLAGFFGLWLLNRPFSSPSASEVLSMRAELFKRGDVGAEIPEIPEFEIPKAYYQTILDSLNGSARDFFPLTWQGLGLIEIRLSTGSIRVGLCWTGHESGAFISNGSYYRGASDVKFVQLIEAASHHKGEP